jgi:hypothetical protein
MILWCTGDLLIFIAIRHCGRSDSPLRSMIGFFDVKHTVEVSG